jgi:UDP:flavonoid glycosyltransferase YjiC (YdhE family)
MAGRVVLTSVGSFGDLHPFIATGLALKARGVEVVVAAAEDYRAKVRQAGLEFRAAGPSVEQLTADTGLDLGGLVERVSRVGTLFLVDRTIIPYAEQTFEELYEAISGADLVVGASFTIFARLAVEKLGLPSVTLLLSPCLFLSAEDPPYLAEAPWLPALGRTLGPRAVDGVLRLGRARLQWRTRRLAAFRRRIGLPPPAGHEVLDVPLQADWIAALY